MIDMQQEGKLKFQTSIDWLYSELKKNIDVEEYEELFIQAKKNEREKIMLAYCSGQDSKQIDAEDYDGSCYEYYSNLYAIPLFS